MTQSSRDFVHSVYEFDALVKRLSDPDWERPTPCERWNVAQLVRHGAWGCSMTAEMARGRPAAVPAEEAGGASTRAAPVGIGRVWAPHLLSFDAQPYEAGGARARAAWAAARDDVLEAFDSCDLQQGTTSLWGHETFDDWLAFAFVDPLVHSWDLATAVGAPMVVDEDLAQRALDSYVAFERGQDLRLPGTLAPSLPADTDASAIARLIAYTGRDLNWSPR